MTIVGSVEMGDKTQNDTHNIQDRNKYLKGKSQYGDSRVEGRIILIWIERGWKAVVWIGFIWHR